MLTTAGLRLEQAPPIGVPFRFFLTAPLFTLAAGLLLTWQGEALMASRWTPAALAGTHLIALGFLTQVMCGALFQMLPVLAGSPVPAARRVGPAGHALLAAGTLALCAGLLGLAPGASGPWLGWGAGLLGLGLAVIALPIAVALARARGAANTVAAMRLALAGLVVTVGLGLVLALAVPGTIRLSDFAAWVDLHLAWGLLGWGGILVMGVGFQVVPMFHVAPAYPRPLRCPPPCMAALSRRRWPPCGATRACPLGDRGGDRRPDGLCPRNPGAPAPPRPQAPGRDLAALVVGHDLAAAGRWPVARRRACRGGRCIGLDRRRSGATERDAAQDRFFFFFFLFLIFLFHF